MKKYTYSKLFVLLFLSVTNYSYSQEANSQIDLNVCNSYESKVIDETSYQKCYSTNIFSLKELSRLVPSIGISITADEFVAIYKEIYKNYLNFSKNNLSSFETNIKKILFNQFYYENKNSSVKASLIDVVDQLGFYLDPDFSKFKNQKNIISYEYYLSLKNKEKNPNQIISFDQILENDEENNTSISSLNNIHSKSYLSGYSNQRIALIIKKNTSSSMLKSDIERRNLYLKMAKDFYFNLQPFSKQSLSSNFLNKEEINILNKTQFMSYEEEKYYLNNLRRMQNSLFQNNQKELNEIIDNAIKDKSILTYCGYENISNDYALHDLSDYKNIFPEISIGHFKLTQLNKLSAEELKRSILVPTFEEVKNKLNYNGINYNESKLINNMFVIVVDNQELFNNMTKNIFINYKSINKSNNLQQKSIIDLSYLSTPLSSPEDRNDFLKISQYLIQYNSIVCAY